MMVKLATGGSSQAPNKLLQFCLREPLVTDLSSLSWEQPIVAKFGNLAQKLKLLDDCNS